MKIKRLLYAVKLLEFYALHTHFPGSHLDVVFTFEAISVLQVHFPVSHLHSPEAIHLHPSTCSMEVTNGFKSILQTGQVPAVS